MATLYFERPKRTWTNKPVMSSTSFSCVDAVVTGLYDQTDITPKDLVRICQELIATDIQKVDNKDGDGYLN
jgi:hypothetical protein